MRFDLVTIFPDFFAGPLDYGIVCRARQAGLVDVRVHDLRDYVHDRHRTVDDRPFGGGEGMVLKPEPLFAAVESLLSEPDQHAAVVEARHPSAALRTSAVPTQSTTRADAVPAGRNSAVILLSASGKLFCQETARNFAQLDRIILLCGRYEGVDERVAEHLATHELSIGDFVLSGGELAAALIVDAVTRLIPGALGNEDSTINESFSAAELAINPDPAVTQHESRITNHQSLGTGHAPPAANHVLLDFPHYTRPAEFRGWNVPEVLLGGNHEEIRRWRAQQALEKTRRNRPDLLR